MSAWIHDWLLSSLKDLLLPDFLFTFPLFSVHFLSLFLAGVSLLKTVSLTLSWILSIGDLMRVEALAGWLCPSIEKNNADIYSLILDGCIRPLCILCSALGTTISLPLELLSTGTRLDKFPWTHDRLLFLAISYGSSVHEARWKAALPQWVPDEFTVFLGIASMLP